MLRSNVTVGEKAQRVGEYAVLTDYAPARYAFRFPNTFVNYVWSGHIPPRMGRRYDISTTGRCGGMAFASLDFFHFKTPVPSVASRGFSPLDIPPDGHPLADYIYTRQLHSMLTKVQGLRDGLRYVRWSGAPKETVLARTIVEEQKVVRSIDRGQPVVLGLIQATSRSLKSQSRNHQVVCYGYRVNAPGHLKFYIYDPNEPYRDSSNTPYAVTLQQSGDFKRSEFPYQVNRPHRIDRWRGFFVAHYRPSQPDPDVLHARSPDGH